MKKPLTLLGTLFALLAALPALAEEAATAAATAAPVLVANRGTTCTPVKMSTGSAA